MGLGAFAGCVLIASAPPIVLFHAIIRKKSFLILQTLARCSPIFPPPLPCRRQLHQHWHHAMASLAVASLGPAVTCSAFFWTLVILLQSVVLRRALDPPLLCLLLPVLDATQSCADAGMLTVVARHAAFASSFASPASLTFCIAAGVASEELVRYGCWHVHR